MPTTAIPTPLSRNKPTFPMFSALPAGTLPVQLQDVAARMQEAEKKQLAAIEQERLAAASTRQEQLRQEADKRQAAAEILLGHLLMVEIMMSNIVQRYVYQVYSTLDERGMLRHSVKQQAKQLRDTATDLISRCNAHDLVYVEQYTQDIYPSLVKPYIDCGGTVTSKLQAKFHAQHAQRINLIYFATKNAFDKMRVSPSDLMTDIFMITMLTQTGIEFYNLICEKSDRLMKGFGRITRVKSNHNERMLRASKELLRLMGCPMEMPAEIACHPRTLTAQFQRELTDVGLLNTIEQSLVSLRMDYIEFVIATLRMKLADGKLSITDIRTLAARVGTIRNVRLLLTEIAAIPLLSSDDWDVIDLAQSLPDSAPESAIATFRRLCIDNHELLPPAEDEETIRLRMFRQESRSNDGLLPLGSLKQLFSELGTKKALLQLLEKGGQELKSTAVYVRNLKVAELKAENTFNH